MLWPGALFLTLQAAADVVRAKAHICTFSNKRRIALFFPLFVTAGFHRCHIVGDQITPADRFQPVPALQSTPSTQSTPDCQTSSSLVLLHFLSYSSFQITDFQIYASC